MKKPTLDPREEKNYRPIASLPFPSKLIEKIMNRQLTDYIDQHQLLDDTQFGFRKGHRTETALIKATEEIRTILDKGGAAILILLDLSVAFDTVDHSILIDRVTSMGLHNKARALLISFLANRTQSVKLGEFLSPTFTLPCGVLQGSTLSPTLFNIYVSDLARVIKSHGMMLTSYADDTQLVLAVHKDGVQVAASFQEGMLAISSWMASNCLKRNSDKTGVMIFGNLQPEWSHNWWPSELGILPTPATKVRNLGIISDEKLSFSNHANTIISSSFYTLKMIRKILPLLPISAGKTLMSTLILSKLDYCNGLFLNAQEKVMNKLQIVQNSAARILSGTPKRISISPVIRDLHWLPVRTRIKFKALCIAYKALNNIGPQFLKSALCPYNPIRALRSARAHLLSVPRTKKTS